MPVKEVTVFKDGHAFLLHAGRMPTDAAGNVVIDALPQPVLGTFWPYSSDKAIKLHSVTASTRKVKLDRTALSVRELIEANVGAQVLVTEMPLTAGAGRDPQPVTYSATIQSIPTQTGEELEAYKDVYTLDVPVTPPPEVMRTFDNNRKAEVARLLAAPKTVHKVRLANTTDAPFTTAPALITSNDRVIAQGMMTYTAVGASLDLDVTTAIDVSVKKKDEEVKRTPDAERWNKETFIRIDMAGKIRLTNYAKQAVELEVVRHVLGNVDSADNGGTKEGTNLLEDATYAPATGFAYPAWYGWYSWPNWWNRFNGVGKVTWSVTVESGKTAELGYAWHYYWR
jgi:hypothetical protein